MGFLDWLFPPSPVPNPNGDADLIACEMSLTEMKNERDSFASQLGDCAAGSNTKDAKISELTLALAQKPPVPGVVNPKEEFWNSKYPKVEDERYVCRYINLAGGKVDACAVDPRIFFQKDGNVDAVALNILASFKVKNKREPTHDERALEALRFVRKTVLYSDDLKVEGLAEYWQFPYETLLLKTGDCEDVAILLANLMLSLGIPYWRIRLNAGSVNGGGHCYVTYCRETDDEFVILDWCYWPNDLPVSERKLHRDEANYSGHDFGIWFSWNTLYVFKKVTFVDGASA